MSTYRRLFSYLRPYRLTYGGAIAAMVVYGATDGVIPFLIRTVLDRIFGARDEGMLYVLPLALIVFALVRGVAGFLQHYLSGVTGLNIVRDIRNAVQEKLLTLSPAFFERHSSGELISRVTNDALLVRMAITDAVAAVLRDSVRIVALLAAALYLDPLLGAIVVLGFPLGFLPIIRFGKKVRSLSRQGQDRIGGLTNILQENILGHKIVLSFGRAEYERDRFHRENERLTNFLRRAEKYGAISAPTNEVFASLAIAGVILYGGLTVIGGVRTQGDFMAFITAVFLLYDPLKKLGRVNNIFQAGISSAERIFEILDAPPGVAEQPAARELVLRAPTVSFEKVSFSYPGSSEMPHAVLRSIDLTVEAGKTVALVGMSGGGKSTLVHLIPRFYDVDRGVVCVGGEDVREVTLDSLRRAISLVNQHIFLFNDTVYNNIRYGNLAASEEEVMCAARDAFAFDFITRLPEGFQTVVGEQGFRLSGGERARLAIARALLKNAPILILDEATASLDSEAEDGVQQAIERLMEGRTVIVIAHRLATVRRADLIAVLVRGWIEEMGTHEDLLARGGEYARLYRMQFREEPVPMVSEL